MTTRPLIVLAGLALPCVAAAPSPREIVKRSVVAMERNWSRAPEYSYSERDVERNGGSQTVRTHEVLMIGGSPYYRLTSVGGRGLSPQQQAEEDRKLRTEIASRNSESAEARSRRIAEFARQRQQDHALMREMAEAFDYRILGERTVANRRVWVLTAVPRPGYQPASLQMRVLKGMRGTLWIDQQDFQWVKVEAEVFAPVAFGMFIAKVQPGTKFVLEQAPVAPGLWLPAHFGIRVDSSILFWTRRTTRDETYWNYQPGPQAAALGAGAAAEPFTR
jgi:hypothetical protein